MYKLTSSAGECPGQLTNISASKWGRECKTRTLRSLKQLEGDEIEFSLMGSFIYEKCQSREIIVFSGESARRSWEILCENTVIELRTSSSCGFI